MSLNISDVIKAGLYASVCGLEMLDRLLNPEVESIIYLTQMQFLNSSEEEEQIYTLGSLVKEKGDDNNIYMITKFVYDEETFNNSYYEVRSIQNFHLGKVIKALPVTAVDLVPEKAKGLGRSGDIEGKAGVLFFKEYGYALLVNILNGLFTYRRNSIANNSSNIFLEKNYVPFVVEIISNNAALLLNNELSVQERIVALDQAIATYFNVSFRPLVDLDMIFLAAESFDNKRIRRATKPYSTVSFDNKSFSDYITNKYDWAQLPLLPSVFFIKYTDKMESLLYNLLAEFCAMFDQPYNDVLNTIHFCTNYMSNPVLEDYLINVTGLTVEEVSSIKPFYNESMIQLTAAHGGSKTSRRYHKKNNTKKLHYQQRGGTKYLYFMGFVFLILTTMMLQSDIVVAQAIGDENEVCVKLSCLFPNANSINDDDSLYQARAKAEKLKNVIVPINAEINEKLKGIRDALKIMEEDKRQQFVFSFVLNPAANSEDTLKIQALEVLNNVPLFQNNKDLQSPIALFLFYDLINSQGDILNNIFKLTQNDAKTLQVKVDSVRNALNGNDCASNFVSNESNQIVFCPKRMKAVNAILNFKPSGATNTQINELRDRIKNLKKEEQESLFNNLFVTAKNKYDSKKYDENSIESRIISQFLETPRSFQPLKFENIRVQLFVFIYKDLLEGLHDNKIYFSKLNRNQVERMSPVVNNIIEETIARSATGVPSLVPSLVPTLEPTVLPQTVSPQTTNANPTVSPQTTNANPTVSPQTTGENPTVSPQTTGENPTVSPQTTNANPTVLPTQSPSSDNNKSTRWYTWIKPILDPYYIVTSVGGILLACLLFSKAISLGKETIRNIQENIKEEGKSELRKEHPDVFGSEKQASTKSLINYFVPEKVKNDLLEEAKTDYIAENPEIFTDQRQLHENSSDDEVSRLDVRDEMLRDKNENE